MTVNGSRSKGNLITGNRDSQLLTESQVEKEARADWHIFRDNMDAIASGVEAWFDENTGYSRKIMETTIEIARALRVPEAEIKQWASCRSTYDTGKGRAIRSLLERLQVTLHC